MVGIHRMSRAPVPAKRIGSVNRMDESDTVDVSGLVLARGAGRVAAFSWEGTRLQRGRRKTPRACFYTSGVVRRPNGPVASRGGQSQLVGGGWT